MLDSLIAGLLIALLLFLINLLVLGETRMASKFVKLAVLIIPKSKRARYREEWLADFATEDGFLNRLLWSIGLLRAGLAIKMIDRSSAKKPIRVTDRTIVLPARYETTSTTVDFGIDSLGVRNKRTLTYTKKMSGKTEIVDKVFDLRDLAENDLTLLKNFLILIGIYNTVKNEYDSEIERIHYGLFRFANNVRDLGRPLITDERESIEFVVRTSTELDCITYGDIGCTSISLIKTVIRVASKLDSKKLYSLENV